jgi:hypothetical protein
MLIGLDGGSRVQGIQLLSLQYGMVPALTHSLIIVAQSESQASGLIRLAAKAWPGGPEPWMLCDLAHADAQVRVCDEEVLVHRVLQVRRYGR